MSNPLIHQINCYYDNCLSKFSFVKKINNKWRVVSHKGKNLGEYDTKEEAEKRLKQIEYFKNVKASLNGIVEGDSHVSASVDLDLSEVEDLSLSAIMRELRKQNDEAAIQFLQLYKKCFDFLSCNVGEDIEEICLQTALDLFQEFHNVKLEKTAADNAQLVGQYLANIIKFTLSRISEQRRPKSIQSLKDKLYRLNESELASKKLPASSSMGQAITFVKHVLFNHDPQYIRQVLNYIVTYL